MDNENLALKLEKCAFFQSEVNWLGHKLTPEGITPKVTKTGNTKIATPEVFKIFEIVYG